MAEAEAEKPVAEEPTEDPSETPIVDTVPPKTFKGTSDKIIKYRSGPFIATITYKGSGNFAVWSLNMDKDQEDLLVNEIGNYRGTVLAPNDEYFGLKVEGRGSWMIRAQPFDQAPYKTGTVKGRGDAVFFWDGPEDTIATIKNKGESNFVVWFYNEDGRDLLVNEIGNYSGEQFIGPGLLQIEATGGTWSMTPE